MLNFPTVSCCQVVTILQLISFLLISNIQILTIKSYLNSLRKHAKLFMNLDEERLPLLGHLIYSKEEL